MTRGPSAERVCWVDADWDRTQASDGISRYGAYLRSHTQLFDPRHDQDAPDRITRDPGEFAVAAFQVATGPIMSPGYVRWHPRVLDHQVSHGDNPEPGRLVVQVTLATSLPLWLGSSWRSWTEYLGRDWCEPDDDRHAALARLELRWPLAVASLPRPRPPVRSYSVAICAPLIAWRGHGAGSGGGGQHGWEHPQRCGHPRLLRGLLLCCPKDHTVAASRHQLPAA